METGYCEDFHWVFCTVIGQKIVKKGDLLHYYFAITIVGWYCLAFRILHLLLKNIIFHVGITGGTLFTLNYKRFIKRVNFCQHSAYNVDKPTMLNYSTKCFGIRYLNTATSHVCKLATLIDVLATHRAADRTTYRVVLYSY